MTEQPAGGYEQGEGDAGGIDRNLIEAVLAAVLAVSAALIFVLAPTLVATPRRTQAGAFPPHAILWIGCGIVAAFSVQWFIRAVLAQRAKETDDRLDRREWFDVLVVTGLLLVGQQLVRPLGLILAAASVYVALMLVYRESSWKFLLLSLGAYVALIYAVFVEFLNIPLPRSIHMQLPF